jgi:hypothetical protein
MENGMENGMEWKRVENGMDLKNQIRYLKLHWVILVKVFQPFKVPHGVEIRVGLLFLFQVPIRDSRKSPSVLADGLFFSILNGQKKRLPPELVTT